VVNNLILTVTRQCNLRCSYCPTAKDGWPSLTPDDSRRALTLFVERFGGGDVKVFGGEPLLVPETVDAALEAARQLDGIRRIYLSTNGLGLNRELLSKLATHPKLILTISLDGRPEQNRRLRRALPGIPDAYDHLLGLQEELVRFPRLVVTQTIAPSAARDMLNNFEHLLDLGFRRFNFLPGYYIAWRAEQLAALREGFDGVCERVGSAWRRSERLYVRNLFTRARTPFFNTGLVVDADRTIHSSNVGLSGTLDDLRTQTRLGDLDAPPSPEVLEQGAIATSALLSEHLPPDVWSSTLAVDAELTRFCNKLYPEYARHYKQRRAA
jgi:MoaA/NifB/PqqE/SkfB family radical SAM enzyme